MEEEAISPVECSDSTVYLDCFRVEVNMDAVVNDAITKVSLPDGTIVTRSGDCDDGEEGRSAQRGCAHFKNANPYSNIYMTYSRAHPISGM